MKTKTDAAVIKELREQADAIENIPARYDGTLSAQWTWRQAMEMAAIHLRVRADDLEEGEDGL